MGTNPVYTISQQGDYKAQAPLGSVVMGGPQTNHLNAENVLFYVSIVCFILGTTLGAVMATWLVLRHTNLQQEGVKKEIRQAVETSWNDGVMWGALAMKNMTDAKEPSNEFGAVMNKAKVLKVQFVAESSKKEGQKVGGDGKVR